MLSLTGLGLIALGTGGIKPCVAAFGGDQFVKGQEVWLEQFFSFFYMCINAGSTLSTAITPVLRAIHCNGQDSCFPLAFGVPAILMVVSVGEHLELLLGLTKLSLKPIFTSASLITHSIMTFVGITSKYASPYRMCSSLSGVRLRTSILSLESTR